MDNRVLLAAAVICAAAWPQPLRAQAWIPAKGEGSVSVIFQDLFVVDHFLDGGGRLDRGHINSNTLFADVTYGVTDKLALTVGVPFMRSRYSGAAPHPTLQDDGSAHYGFQDVRFAARYNVLSGPITVTPFVGVNLPTHHYEYFAHAAYGTRVREVEVGAYVGRLLSPALPNAFVQARYSYSFAQRIADVHHDRSNLDLEVGYFVAPSVRVFAIGSGHKTHGGIPVPDAGWRAMPAQYGQHHDRIGRIDLLDAITGVQVSITKSLDVFGSYTRSLAGRNTHALQRGLTIGASWSFGQGLSSLMRAENRARSDGKARMARCLCQK